MVALSGASKQTGRASMPGGVVEVVATCLPNSDNDANEISYPVGRSLEDAEEHEAG